MNIEFCNLGPVKKANINLGKDLIILCGPNNTGKTYVAYAIYGLFKMKSEIIVEVLLETEKLYKTLQNKARIESGFRFFLSEIEKRFSNQIFKVLGGTQADFKEFSIKIFQENNHALQETIFNSIREIKLLEKEFLNRDNVNDEIKIADDEFYSNYKESLNKIINRFFPNTYIAPAERIAINIFSKELSLKRNNLVNELLEIKNSNKNIDPFDLINRRATRYSAPIRDSLEIAEDLSNFKKQSSQFEYLALEIEKEILKGKLSISSEGEVQFNPDLAENLMLPIHLSASSVKSLSSLVIYFRHLAQPGDFIIIDEPELNLHPDNQVIVARIIAKIVNNGFRVLISTHSDYIIRELNILMMLKSKPELASKFNIGTDSILDFNKVGALMFRYNQDECENLVVDESGFAIETIDQTINAQNERAQELYFNLTENE